MNKLIIKNRLETELTDKNWKDGFIAVDEERHWEEGRSAERLANDFTNGNPSTGEVSIRNMVSLFLKTDDIEWEKAFIEHGSVFDSNPRPRMQDLAVWGKASGKSIFIGVEAKVDEPFGSKSVAQQKKYVNGLLEKGVNTKARERLYDLCNDFLTEINEEEYKNIRYQLLYYLAGSFREDADIIFMPVFAYKSDKYDSVKGEQNYKNYLKFMEALGFKSVKGKIQGMRSAFKKTITAPNKKRTENLTKTVYSCYFEK